MGKKSRKHPGGAKQAPKRQKVETLLERNAHPRDAQIEFFEGPHVYEVNGSSAGYTSVTTWIHEWFPHFDGDAVCQRMLTKANWLTKDKYGWVVKHAREYLQNVVGGDKRERHMWKIFCQQSEGTVDIDSVPMPTYLRWRIGRKSWTTDPLFAELKRAILQSWEDNREQAADEGTLMHAIIEYYFNNNSTDETLQNIRLFLKWRNLNPHLRPYFPRKDGWDFGEALAGNVEAQFTPMTEPGVTYEVKSIRRVSWERIQKEAAWDPEKDGTTLYGREIQLFFEWLATHPDWEPYKPEGRIWSAQHKLAGSVDMLFRHRETGQIIVVDWKRSKEIERTNPYCFCRGEHNSEVCDAFGNKNLTSDLAHCNYNHYSLQLHTYSALLSQFYEMEISGRYLVVLHPSQPEPLEIEAAPELGERVRMMLEERAMLVTASQPSEQEGEVVLPSSESIVSWNTKPAKIQRKARKLVNKAGDTPKLKFGRKKHPEYTVTLHLSNQTHDLFEHLQPMIWPADTRRLELSCQIPSFDRPYKQASTEYMLVVRLFELTADASRMIKVSEVTSRNFQIVSHPRMARKIRSPQ